MRRSATFLLLLAIALAPGPARADPDGGLPVRALTRDQAYRALWYPGRRTTFAPTTSDERRVFRRLLPGLLLAARDPAPDLAPLAAMAATVGFELQVWDVDGRTFWAVIEQRGRARGAGAYVVRPGPPAPGREVVLQAPHADFDRHTGPLVARIFFDPPGDVVPRAFFANTIQRYRGAEGHEPPPDLVGPPPPSPLPADADVCHNRNHLFTTASAAAASALGSSTFVQVHGFADTSVAPSEGLPVLAVVSAGDPHGSSVVSRAVGTALQDVLGPGIRLYPDQVKRMGGTLNVVGRRLRRFPDAAFVHLELAWTLRRALRADDVLLADAGRALLTAAAVPDPVWPGALDTPAPPEPATARGR